jgi:hypothetical protein
MSGPPFFHSKIGQILVAVWAIEAFARAFWKD